MGEALNLGCECFRRGFCSGKRFGKGESVLEFTGEGAGLVEAEVV